MTMAGPLSGVFAGFVIGGLPDDSSAWATVKLVFVLLVVVVLVRDTRRTRRLRDEIEQTDVRVWIGGREITDRVVRVVHDSGGAIRRRDGRR